ncbi:MAG: KAP family P-loop NTPase fold protein [Parvibaculaceae bacterium]
MWRDSESDQDFLNFTELAEQIATLATSPRLLPISIGVFGTWGTGKSTVLSLTEQKLKKTNPIPIIIKFDAWLYQGFDDAKAALMEVVADRLLEEVKDNADLWDKAKGFAARVNYFRALGMAADFGIGMAFGVPPGLLTKAGSAIGALVAGGGDATDAEALKEAGQKTSEAWSQLILPEKSRTPPKEIAAFRQEFGEIIAELGRPLVLFIDNLDRCLPDVAIGTLEAIRLFLFIEGTAFVIAADEDMIRHSVTKHFGDINSRHVHDYLDKVIQVPMRVPQVSAEDVRAYMYSLFVGLYAPQKLQTVQAYLLNILQTSWTGATFSRKEIYDLAGQPSELLDALSVCDRLAPILTAAPTINGNPRIVKRLLNAITLRQTLAASRGMNVELGTLAKLAVFERSTDAKASQRLYRLVMEENGAEDFLNSSTKLKTDRPDLPPEWKGYENFIENWREMDPHFENAAALRPALFLSRDVMAPSLGRTGLSEAAKNTLEALVEVNSVNSPAGKELAENLLHGDQILVIGELITHLRKQDWSKSPSGIHGSIILAQISADAKDELKAYVSTLQKKSMHKATRFLLESTKLLEKEK